MRFLYLALCALAIFFIILFIWILKNNTNEDLLVDPIFSKPAASVKNKSFEVKGSIPYWDQEDAFSSVQKNPSSLNYINLFWYFLDDSGEIQKYQYAKEDKAILAFAHSNNIKVFATITNLPESSGSGWDSKRVEKILNNPDLRKKHINDILEKLEGLNFDGIIIDYEQVNSSQKNRFSEFIKELKLTLQTKNKLLAVALHPKKTKADEKNSIGAFQDWKALAQSADHLNIMAYGEHYDEGSSGPIASIPWLEEIIQYAKSLNIPAEKIYLGVPLYGYDWDKEDDDQANGLTYVDVLSLQKKYSTQEKWDEKSRSPYFTYEENGDNHEVWFENGRSFQEKINLAKNAGLAGITFWRLGDEDPGIWDILKDSR